MARRPYPWRSARLADLSAFRERWVQPGGRPPAGGVAARGHGGFPFPAPARRDRDPRRRGLAADGGQGPRRHGAHDRPAGPAPETRPARGLRNPPLPGLSAFQGPADLAGAEPGDLLGRLRRRSRPGCPHAASPHGAGGRPTGGEPFRRHVPHRRSFEPLEDGRPWRTVAGSRAGAAPGERARGGQCLRGAAVRQDPQDRPCAHPADPQRGRGSSRVRRRAGRIWLSAHLLGRTPGAVQGAPPGHRRHAGAAGDRAPGSSGRGRPRLLRAAVRARSQNTSASKPP